MDFWNSESPRKWIARFLLVSLVTGFVASSDAQAPTHITTAQFQDSVSGLPSAAADPAIVGEIIAIRDQLGGGLTKAFEGLSFTNGDRTSNYDSLTREPMCQWSAEFASALESIASAGQDSIRDPSAGGSQLNAYAVLPVNGKLAIEPSLAYFEVASNSSQALLESLQKAEQCLRQVARQLDNLAADLEDVEQYEHADLLRGEATRIREQVRHAKTSNPTILK